MFSCKKEGIEGPSLNDLYGELNFETPLAIVGDSANFSQNEDVYFTAEFSKIVDWKITITGLNSSVYFHYDESDYCSLAHLINDG